MKTQKFLAEKRFKRKLSRKDISKALGVSEKHVYDLESNDSEIEDTLNIDQIYKLAHLLDAQPSNLCSILKSCHISELQAFNNIKQLIKNANEPIGKLSDKIGWNLEVCVNSIESIRMQPIMFFNDLAIGFEVQPDTILPKLYENK